MFDLLAAEAKRIWILYKRYPLQLLGSLIMSTISFYALFLGARYMAGPAFQFGDRTDGLILGYGLWMLVTFNLNRIASFLQAEAKTGTLEQVYLSSFGPVTVIMARAVASVGVSIGISFSLLIVMLYITGRQLSFPAVTLLPLLSAVIGSFGLGLGIGALALVFKRIRPITRFFQFILLALVIVPVELWEGSQRWVGLLLPIAPAAGQLRDLMSRGQSFDLGYFGLTLLNGTGHFLFGLLLFLVADRVARNRGLLGQY
ncbi:MAG: ABC transporter permease [bacterium]|nr:ABC transporter permease [bacterium]